MEQSSERNEPGIGVVEAEAERRKKKGRKEGFRVLLVDGSGIYLDLGFFVGLLNNSHQSIIKISEIALLPFEITYSLNSV